MRLVRNAGSPSIEAPDYWWYQVRADLLERVMAPHLEDMTRLLDVGSADGPSVGWLRGRGHRVALDLDPRGLEPGDVCGSATELPFADESFDVVAAFDVVEHCASDAEALTEIARVLVPGGRLLMSVPAYRWAWTWHDDLNGHHHRYTRRRARAAVASAGLTVRRDTYAFCGVMPFFTADRLITGLRQRNRPVPVAEADEVPPLPEVGALAERILLGASALDRTLLATTDLPFGSSVFVVAEKPIDSRTAIRTR